MRSGIAVLLTVASLWQVEASWIRHRKAIDEEGAMRLVDGEGDHEGRVEIYHDGTWGTVCDDWFSGTEASVVCHYLGYEGGTAKYKGFFGAGSGPIHLDTIQCEGNETSLANCWHADWGEHDCSHNEDAGAICEA